MVLANVVLGTAGFPLLAAWQANRATTLRSTLGWATAAWVIWGLAAGLEIDLLRYLALCLTACAGVAVLGAERRRAGPWNFVVGGLLAVLLLPLAHGMGTPRLEMAYLVFFGIVLAVPAVNYLPTRLGPGLLICAAGSAGELVRLSAAEPPPWLPLAVLFALAGGCWVAWLNAGYGAGLSPFDRLWLEFRDRFGFVWAQRARTQFNLAAGNAGLPVVLTWHGLRRTGECALSDEKALMPMLKAVLKRYGPADSP